MRSRMFCVLPVLLGCWAALPAEAAAENAPAKSEAEDRAVEAAPHRRIRFGGLAISAGYARYAGPFCCGYWAYDPWFYSPVFYSPYYFSGFARGPDMGHVKLQTSNRAAEVFLDGAYAGTAADLKSIWLRPGAYTLEVKEGPLSFERRIYVLSGKTLKIHAQLRTEKEVRP